MLGLPPDAADFVLMPQELVYSITEKDNVLSLKQNEIKNLLFVRFRSMYGIMTYLSHAVEIPESDIKAGTVTRVREDNGRIYDWNQLLHGVMTIHSSDRFPDNAFVRTRFKGHWFYITNDDIDSKITFSLLVRLEFLTKGQNSEGQAAPILTIPVR
jgi:hypothetical protein